MLVFLTSKNLDLFDQARPLLDRVVHEAAHGEFDSDALKKLIEKEHAWGACVIDDDDQVELVCLWEMVFFPNRTVCNVIALGGKNLKESWAVYGDTMSDLWRAQGAEVVTSYCNKGMTRLLRWFGFKPAYVYLEKEL